MPISRFSEHCSTSLSFRSEKNNATSVNRREALRIAGIATLTAGVVFATKQLIGERGLRDLLHGNPKKVDANWHALGRGDRIGQYILRKHAQTREWYLGNPEIPDVENELAADRFVLGETRTVHTNEGPVYLRVDRQTGNMQKFTEPR